MSYLDCDVASPVLKATEPPSRSWGVVVAQRFSGGLLVILSVVLTVVMTRQYLLANSVIGDYEAVYGPVSRSTQTISEASSVHFQEFSERVSSVAGLFGLLGIFWYALSGWLWITGTALLIPFDRVSGRIAALIVASGLLVNTVLFFALDARTVATVLDVLN